MRDDEKRWAENPLYDTESVGYTRRDA